jgi:hypothetical protein
MEKLAKYSKAYGPTADENASWHISIENGRGRWGNRREKPWVGLQHPTPKHSR